MMDGSKGKIEVLLNGENLQIMVNGEFSPKDVAKTLGNVMGVMLKDVPVEVWAGASMTFINTFLERAKYERQNSSGGAPVMFDCGRR